MTDFDQTKIAAALLEGRRARSRQFRFLAAKALAWAKHTRRELR